MSSISSVVHHFDQLVSQHHQLKTHHTQLQQRVAELEQLLAEATEQHAQSSMTDDIEQGLTQLIDLCDQHGGQENV